MTRYLTVEEVIKINGKVLGGSAQLRDPDLLGAAVGRPMASAFGEDAYPGITEKAAALFHSLIDNHAFVDGNKRTATVAVIFFLEENGFRVIWEASAALDFILEIAQGKQDVPRIAAWLRRDGPHGQHPRRGGDRILLHSVVHVEPGDYSPTTA